MTHYDTLEIHKDASVEDIKKAYKNLARKYHPDKGGDAERFKKISQAYEILSDPEKRMQYDQFGDNPPPPSPFMDNIFEQMFQQKINRRADHQHIIELSLDEVFTGTSKNMKITSTRPCFSCLTPCGACKGSGSIGHSMGMGFMFQSPCPSCQGVGRFPKGCEACQFNRSVQTTTSIGINIHSGISDGFSQKIVGLGEQPRTPNEKAGDLIVIFRVKKHPVFERHGDNLRYTLTITFEESVNGYEFTVPHLSGPFSFNTKEFGPVIDPRKDYPIKGKGLTKDSNLYVNFDIKYPTSGEYRVTQP